MTDGAAPGPPRCRPLSCAYRIAIDACGAGAALLIAAIALGISADVVTRNFRIVNLVWMIEAVEYAILAATFLSAPWVLYQGEHVRVDLFVSSLSASAKHRLDIAANLIGFVVSSLLLYYGARVAYDAYHLDTKIFRTMVVKEWWLLSTLPFSACLMAIEFLRRLSARPRADDASATGDAHPGR
jgi:TRAP-type C4-dicarboxylate transport system permease small subunit